MELVSLQLHKLVPGYLAERGQALGPPELPFIMRLLLESGRGKLGEELYFALPERQVISIGFPSGLGGQDSCVHSRQWRSAVEFPGIKRDGERYEGQTGADKFFNVFHKVTYRARL